MTNEEAISELEEISHVEAKWPGTEHELQALDLAISALRAQQEKNEPLTLEVIDPKTGEYPDLYEIALHEEWAKGLMYCDMEGFALEEDGTLLLLDECGKFEYCPDGRFAYRHKPKEDKL